MRKSGKEYVQAYNAQAAVDSEAQVIVAQGITNCASDAQQLEPMVKQIKENTGRPGPGVLRRWGLLLRGQSGGPRPPSYRRLHRHRPTAPSRKQCGRSAPGT